MRMRIARAPDPIKWRRRRRNRVGLNNGVVRKMAPKRGATVE